MERFQPQQIGAPANRRIEVHGKNLFYFFGQEDDPVVIAFVSDPEMAAFRMHVPRFLQPAHRLACGCCNFYC